MIWIENKCIRISCKEWNGFGLIRATSTHWTSYYKVQWLEINSKKSRSSSNSWALRKIRELVCLNCRCYLKYIFSFSLSLSLSFPPFSFSIPNQIGPWVRLMRNLRPRQIKRRHSDCHIRFFPPYKLVFNCWKSLAVLAAVDFPLATGLIQMLGNVKSSTDANNIAPGYLR